MLVGGLLATIALFLMSVAPTLVRSKLLRCLESVHSLCWSQSWLSLSFLLLSVSNNIIIAPFAALVPDVVPAEQRGLPGQVRRVCMSFRSIPCAQALPAAGWAV